MAASLSDVGQGLNPSQARRQQYWRCYGPTHPTLVP